MGIFNFGYTHKNEINWQELKSIQDLDAAIELSNEKPVLIFKHSTRCSISSMALNRTETGWDLTDEEVVPFYLDLIAHRDISSAIVDKLDVFHQSPQIILIKNEKAILDASHNQIRVDIIKQGLN